jgi:hypothetical protein
MIDCGFDKISVLGDICLIRGFVIYCPEVDEWNAALNDAP